MEECRDLRTSPLDCGKCGTRCPSLVCQEGRCLSEDEADQAPGSDGKCAEGTILCPGNEDPSRSACVDPLSDFGNCGSCGNRCQVNGVFQICQNGACVLDQESSCPAGQVLCDAECTDLQTDQVNCGVCGNACPNYPEFYSCEGGVCVAPSCDPLVDCGGLCVDLQTDPLACGACDVTCGAGQACSNGACACAAGLIDCFGACVDLQSDPNNCGYCGTVCPSGQCGTGVCIEPVAVGPAPGCAAGTTDCGSGCIDLLSDVGNCGVCGNACTPTGVGAPNCCGGRCADLLTDATSCGACGYFCPAGNSCQGGTCYSPV